MRFVYFTKTLQSLDIPSIVRFLKDVGLDGADLAVRDGYPVNPGNVRSELPAALRAFRDHGLIVALVTAETRLTDPDSPAARTLFEVCGQAGIPAIKIGYFVYKGKFEETLAEARRRLAGFARLAARTGTKAVYHTHSGNMLGSNAAALRLLLQDLDPHHVGAYVDTGHVAIGGAPIGLELDMVRPWFSQLAIKDMAWEQSKDGWRSRVVPVGRGIVRWDEVARALRDCGFQGTVSLHAEYEAKDLVERQRLAKEELTTLRTKFTTGT
ncbi:MAG: sugar phosphate isomerase/epimerase [Gemmataceae bacterium]|nr:sugar phosphate isomerase/epimerase [Gemmataceae bacterium]MDW8264044.1 sugar phosphate isomerase/epimerase family protein [Gemmataceae bacterium]